MSIRAIYCGFQEGIPSRNIPGFELWTLVDQAGVYLPGSTVTRKTIEAHGVLVDVTKQ